MTIALLAALVAVNIAYLFVLDRAGKRAFGERTKAEHDWSAYAVDLNRQLERQADAHRADVQTLLQRIQAPEVAVVQHQQQTLPDETTWPLTDEESAEAQNERQRMIAELERIENAGLV